MSPELAEGSKQRAEPITSETSSATTERAARLLPLVALLFAGSGCSALIYEIVWYQLLQLSVGSTAVSLGVLLATFMGGLCIGSILLPRILKKTHHPLLVYAIIEAGIGIIAGLELVLIPLIDSVYVSGPQSGFAGMLFRGLIAAIALLPPTILMGASLPAIVRWVKSSPAGISWWGLLYGANIVGAVFGCLFAGFFLLRVYNIYVATFAGVAINLAVAAVSAILARHTLPSLSPAETGVSEKTHAPKQSAAALWTVYVAIALSGASALGAEVVWTRLMGLTLGATVYAFSIILAVFLAGLAIGTAAASRLTRTLDPWLALGWCQLLAALGIAWTAYVISGWLPYWPINPQLSPGPLFTFQLDLVRSVLAILPPTLLWGASFPFAFAAAARSKGDPGATVGGIYAANTAGAIAGALAASLVLIPAIGTQNTQRAMLALAAISGLIVLVPLMNRMRSLKLEISAGIVLGFAGLFFIMLNAVPGELIAYGRRIAIQRGNSEVLYTAEGRNTSIAVTRWLADGAIQFHVAGKVEASTESFDMKLQRMLGHLPGLINPNARSVLVVGFGGGVTAGTFTRYPNIERLVICELEPLIPPASTRYFAAQNYNVMNDPRTEIVYDDARHFVATSSEKFDIITSDPIHPFVKGSATLYSREYFEMVRAHLNPGGVVTQWVPLYESDPATVKSEFATFFEVFPNGTVWANLLDGTGYDIVLVGTLEETEIDLDAIEQRLMEPALAPVAASLADVQFGTATDLFATYAGSSQGLATWLRGAAINHDYDLRLQYLAGLALNRSQEDAIYRAIMQFWAPPLNLFKGSPMRLDSLFTAMAARAGPAPAN